MKTSIMIALLFAGGCVRNLHVPRSITPNVERATLEEVVRGPAPPEDAVVFLVGEYLTERRLHDGYAFFHERSRAAPDSALFEALDGFFEVQLAPEVSLLDRVDHVNRALAKLDHAAERAPHSAARLFRAFVLARLPDRFERQAQAVSELETLTRPDAKLPLIVMHDAYLALAQAYTNVGRAADATRALARSGYRSLDGKPVGLETAIAISPRDGTRYEPEWFGEVAPGILAVYGFDYGDFFFVIGDRGVIAIDAGAVPARVGRAKQRLRARTQLPITHVILTHAHWDHAGGLTALLEPGTKVIASARYTETIANMAPFDIGKQSWFIGDGGTTPRELPVDVMIAERTTMTIDGIELTMIPVAGAETADSLLIEMPSRHVVFTGDVIADLGIPFLDEGSTDGFIHGLQALARYGVETTLLHGHQPIGDLMPHDKLAGLAIAFDQLRAAVLADIHGGLGMADVLRRRGIVARVREQPALVVPFLMFREAFVQRLFREQTGPWAMSNDDLEPATRRELGAALDLVAGHDPARIAAAASRLIESGDFGLARQVAELGLAAHAGDRELTELRRQALQRLLERSERWDFFKTTVYSQLTATPIPPPLR